MKESAPEGCLLDLDMLVDGVEVVRDLSLFEPTFQDLLLYFPDWIIDVIRKKMDDVLFIYLFFSLQPRHPSHHVTNDSLATKFPIVGRK